MAFEAAGFFQSKQIGFFFHDGDQLRIAIGLAAKPASPLVFFLKEKALRAAVEKFEAADRFFDFVDFVLVESGQMKSQAEGLARSDVGQAAKGLDEFFENFRNHD